MQKLVGSALALLLIAGPAPAPLIGVMDDDCDDVVTVFKVYDQKDVAQFRQKLNYFAKRLYPLKEKDFIALFGKSQVKPAKVYAMPVAQSREIFEPGLFRPPLRAHSEFYVIKEVAALQVQYGPDGESPRKVIFYFPTDKDFPKLNADNIAKRLLWDDDHLKKLAAYFDKKMVEVFPWEVDRQEQAKLHQGDFAVGAKFKMETWIELGKKLGFIYKREEGSDEWYLYRSNGKPVCKAYRELRDGLPCCFIWYYEDGVSELREVEIRCSESGQILYCREQWRQSKNGRTIREEISYGNSITWTWYAKNGEPVREEWDDNGDGIPDWYKTKQDFVSKKEERELRNLLNIEDSWAINSKLVPEESRISDHPDLRVPIRKKGMAETETK